MTVNKKPQEEEIKIQDMSFEEAFAELENIVKNINSGNQELDSVVKLFGRACDLSKHCQEKLDTAKLKISEMTKDMEGNINSKEITAF